MANIGLMGFKSLWKREYTDIFLSKYVYIYLKEMYYGNSTDYVKEKLFLSI